LSSEILNMREFTRDTPVTIHSSEGSVGMSVADVLKWVEPKAPPQEALKFLLSCKSAGLNPFLKEAFLLEIGGKWATVIAKSGYLKVAQNHRGRDGEFDFDGFEAGVVVQAQRTDPRTGQPMPGTSAGPPVEVEGTLIPHGHLLVGGWARVWRKGVSRPTKSVVSMTEYAKMTTTWKSIPATMIRKVALVHAIRETFAVGDSYDESEFEPVPAAGRNGAGPVTAARVVEGLPGSPGGPAAIEAHYADSPDPVLPPHMVEAIHRLVAEAQAPAGWLDGVLMKRGAAAVGDLSVEDASLLIARLEGLVSRVKVAGAFPSVAKDVPPMAAFDGSMPLDVETHGPGDGPTAMPAGPGGEDRPVELVGAGGAARRSGYAELPVDDDIE
jgi:phage recombination protein Bet